MLSCPDVKWTPAGLDALGRLKELRVLGIGMSLLLLCSCSYCSLSAFNGSWMLFVIVFALHVYIIWHAVAERFQTASLLLRPGGPSTVFAAALSVMVSRLTTLTCQRSARCRICSICACRCSALLARTFPGARARQFVCRVCL